MDIKKLGKFFGIKKISEDKKKVIFENNFLSLGNMGSILAVILLVMISNFNWIPLMIAGLIIIANVICRIILFKKLYGNIKPKYSVETWSTFGNKSINTAYKK